jgi:hypothetical protein
MWDPQRLTTLWAFTARYRDSFTFTFLLLCSTSAVTRVLTYLVFGLLHDRRIISFHFLGLLYLGLHLNTTVQCLHETKAVGIRAISFPRHRVGKQDNLVARRNDTSGTLVPTAYLDLSSSLSGLCVAGIYSHRLDWLFSV